MVDNAKAAAPDVRRCAYAQASEGVVVLVHAADNPSDDEWDAYLAFVRSVRLPPDRLRTLVFSDGGRPSHAQRAKLAALVRGRPSRVAIVTDAASIAFISAQLNLEGPLTKTFECTAFAGAVAHLGLSEAQLASVRTTVPRLVAEVARCDAALAALAAVAA